MNFWSELTRLGVEELFFHSVFEENSLLCQILIENRVESIRLEVRATSYPLTADMKFDSQLSPAKMTNDEKIMP